MLQIITFRKFGNLTVFLRELLARDFIDRRGHYFFLQWGTKNRHFHQLSHKILHCVVSYSKTDTEKRLGEENVV